AFHALAASLRCVLIDAREGHPIEANPEDPRGAALAYLSDYEADVRRARALRSTAESDDNGMGLLAWLAREGHVLLAEDPGALAATLPMEDPPLLYEMLLESDAIEDVFVSERELTDLLSRFRARTNAAP
ncbi:MAG TPA: hypothetical protein VM580_27345, partial [Labilithrix sp.]|nr:hypothetical protein [Labilithrix sp.]